MRSCSGSWVWKRVRKHLAWYLAARQRRLHTTCSKGRERHQNKVWWVHIPQGIAFQPMFFIALCKAYKIIFFSSSFNSAATTISQELAVEQQRWSIGERNCSRTVELPITSIGCSQISYSYAKLTDALVEHWAIFRMLALFFNFFIMNLYEKVHPLCIDYKNAHFLEEIKHHVNMSHLKSRKEVKRGKMREKR